MNELKNRIALITGGSRGIGAAVAIALAKAGAYVAVNFMQLIHHPRAQLCGRHRTGIFRIPEH